MSAGSKALFAALCLASSLAWSQGAASPLDERLRELRETSRFQPELALVELKQLEPQGRAAAQPTRVEFLAVLSHSKRRVGQLQAAAGRRRSRRNIVE